MRLRQIGLRLLPALCLLAAVLFPAEAVSQQGKPTVCLVLAARIPIVDGAPASETDFDTERLQAALNRCPAGQAVELSSAAGADAFLLAPIHLPAGVELWIDAGVTVFASRFATDYVVPDSAPRALIAADAGATPEPAASLGGYGIIDARGAAPLLSFDGSPGGGWFDRPPLQRPAVIAAGGTLTVAGITVRDAPGVAISAGAAVELRDVKIIGNPAAQGTQALASSGSASVRIADSTLVASGPVFMLPARTRMPGWLSSTRIYSGRLSDSDTAAPCLADSDPGPVCVPSLFPATLAELLQTAPEEASVILTTPDTRLPAPAGTVSLLEDDTVLGSAALRSSAAVFDLSALRSGSHRLRARLDSTGEMLGTFTVALARPADAPATLNLTASATTFSYGRPLTLTASLAGATGAVTFFDGANKLGQTVMSGGSASITVSSLELGPHTVYAVYAGDTLNPVQQSPSLTLQVNPVTTILSLGALPPSVPYGTTLTLASSVLPVTATGMVSYHDGAATLGQATLSGGSASLQVANLLPGAHTLTASYAGDRYDLSATSPAVHTTVEQLTTSTALAAMPATVSFGAMVTLNVAVSPADSTGTVTILDGVSVLARLALSNGAASTTLSALAPGLHLLVASYPGDALHTASSSSSTAVQVDRLSTSTVLAPLPTTIAGGAPIVLLATVTPGSATGMVSFTDRNSGALGQSSLVAGSATITLPQLGPGPHSIVATYAGDTDDAPSSSAPVSTTVELGAATLLLSGVPATLAYASPAALTASVTPSAASGSITLLDSISGSLGTALLSGGAGSFSLPPLPPGAHTLQAKYSGDASFAPALASLTVTVVPDPTTTSLSAAQATVPAGSPVLLNVRVATAYSNSPGGTVSIRISSATGSVAVPGTLLHALPGEAFATVSVDSTALGLGSFSAVASYAGDANDEPSSSAAVGFSVVPAPVSLLFTLSANPVAAGVPVTLQASVSSLSGSPAGSVAFSRDGSLLGSVPVVNGLASLSLGGAKPGTYTLTAGFTPSGLFGPAVAPAQVLVVTLPISIALNPTGLNMKAGTDASATLQITPLSGYTGTYAASCSPSSPYVTCSIDPATGPGPSSPLVHVHAAATTVAQRERVHSSGWLALGLPLLLLLPRRRPRACLLMLCAMVLMPVMGCGKGDFFDLPPGGYPVTITVTAAGSSLTASLNVVIVKQ